METLQSVLVSLHFNFTAFVMQLVLFVAFHYAMRAVLYDKLLEVRSARDGQIDGRLAQAKSSADKAQQLKSEYEASIRKIREELAGKLHASIAEAESAAAAALAVARDEAGKVLDEARGQIEAEEKKMEAEMEQRVDKLARSIARRVVEQNFSSGSQAKILSKIGG